MVAVVLETLVGTQPCWSSVAGAVWWPARDCVGQRKSHFQQVLLTPPGQGHIMGTGMVWPKHNGSVCECDKADCGLYG